MIDSPTPVQSLPAQRIPYASSENNPSVSRGFFTEPALLGAHPAMPAEHEHTLTRLAAEMLKHIELPISALEALSNKAFNSSFSEKASYSLGGFTILAGIATVAALLALPTMPLLGISGLLCIHLASCMARIAGHLYCLESTNVQKSEDYAMEPLPRVAKKSCTFTSIAQEAPSLGRSPTFYRSEHRVGHTA